MCDKLIDYRHFFTLTALLKFLDKMSVNATTFVIKISLFILVRRQKIKRDIVWLVMIN